MLSDLWVFQQQSRKRLIHAGISTYAKKVFKHRYTLVGNAWFRAKNTGFFMQNAPNICAQSAIKYLLTGGPPVVFVCNKVTDRYGGGSCITF